MVLDDSKWFAAQERIRQELAPMADEMYKMLASSVKSEHEEMVHQDVIKWLLTQPYETSTLTWKNIYNKFWNERLN